MAPNPPGSKGLTTKNQNIASFFKKPKPASEGPMPVKDEPIPGTGMNNGAHTVKDEPVPVTGLGAMRAAESFTT